jgi:hypothetical protein
MLRFHLFVGDLVPTNSEGAKPNLHLQHDVWESVAILQPAHLLSGYRRGFPNCGFKISRCIDNSVCVL